MQNLYYTRLKKNCYCKRPRPNFFSTGACAGKEGERGSGRKANVWNRHITAARLFFAGQTSREKRKPHVFHPREFVRARDSTNEIGEKGINEKNFKQREHLDTAPFFSIWKCDAGKQRLINFKGNSIRVARFTPYRIYKYEGERSSFLLFVSRIRITVNWEIKFLRFLIKLVHISVRSNRVKPDITGEKFASLRSGE